MPLPAAPRPRLVAQGVYLDAGGHGLPGRQQHPQALEHRRHVAPLVARAPAAAGRRPPRRRGRVSGRHLTGRRETKAAAPSEGAHAPARLPIVRAGGACALLRASCGARSHACRRPRHCSCDPRPPPSERPARAPLGQPGARGPAAPKTPSQERNRRTMAALPRRHSDLLGRPPAHSQALFGAYYEALPRLVPLLALQALPRPRPQPFSCATACSPLASDGGPPARPRTRLPPRQWAPGTAMARGETHPLRRASHATPGPHLPPTPHLFRAAPTRPGAPLS
jgi:hypothetical protein